MIPAETRAMNILRLHPENGDPTIVVDAAIAMVGRDPSADVHLKDASVSRQHAEITRRGEDWVILDQNSGNGVFVDGRRRQQAVLLPGQKLQIGSLKFRVEIDRGNEGATVMLGRPPVFDESDRTLLGDGPPVFPPPDAPAGPAPAARGKSGWVVGAVIVAVLVGGAFAAVKYFSDQQLKAKRAAAAAAVIPRPTPTPTPAPTPEPTPVPTPAPTRRPTGWLLVSTDVDVAISVDGRPVAQLKAAGLRRFDVAPGEHIVRFRSGGAESEMVVRVRVNEQTVVRHQSQDAAPIATPLPLASITPR
jgi:hypothetical protein